VLICSTLQICSTVLTCSTLLICSAVPSCLTRARPLPDSLLGCYPTVARPVARFRAGRGPIPG